MLKLVNEIKRLDSDSKKILVDLLNVIFNSIGGATKDDFVELTNNFKNHFMG